MGDLADARIDAATPVAAELVCAVADHDAGAVADALRGLDVEQLHAVLILLAANVAEDSMLAARSDQPPSYRAIVEHALCEVTASFGVSRDAVLSTSRHSHVAEARAVAMAACRLAGMTSVAIGEAFDRDHSTVLHAATRVGENSRLHRISRRIAAPVTCRSGVLGDEVA